MKIFQRGFALLLTLFLLTGIVSIPGYAAESTMYGIGFVTADSLRLRSEANSTSAIVATAPQNDCVAVISKEGQWYKVNYNLQTGYMHENYLRVSACENAELGYGQIIGSGVNLRTGPGTGYGVSAVSTQNERCYILGLNNGWFIIIK